MKSVSSSESNNFKFGKQIIKNDTTLTISKNKILFSRVDKDKFSYVRNDSENKTTKNIIHCRAGDLEIEIAPVLPIHLPTYKTDFVFIRFTDPIFISGKSTTELTVPFPIEIGIFLINDEQTDMLDCFSCEPSNSRFGLYGTPEEGRLCKYAKTPSFVDKNTQSPLVHTDLRIAVENELEESVHVGKIIIPASDHDLYYNGENVMMDELRIEIKNRGGLKIIEVVQKPIATPDNWSLAPRNIKKTDYKFSMEWGFS